MIGYSSFIEETPAEELTFPLLQITDNEGNKLSTFGESVDFGEEITNYSVNGFNFVLDDNDNIYLAFRYLNKIENYSQDGRNDSGRAGLVSNRRSFCTHVRPVGLEGEFAVEKTDI
ncbi:hypothetical protein ACFL5L_00355 [candidate division KSB1 bacterium]